MTALHTLGILSTSFTWNAFPTVLKEFPHMLSTCWLLFLHSAVQLIANHLNWVEDRLLWRPGHVLQHSITLLLGQIALTQPGSVLCHCPVEKVLELEIELGLGGWVWILHMSTCDFCVNLISYAALTHTHTLNLISYTVQNHLIWG
jgi:hypothetical protein